MFEGVAGNEAVKTYLRKMVENRAISNSLLFAGPEGVGKSLFALQFAALLFGEAHHRKIFSGNHPDLHVYRPEGKLALHSIDSMRCFCEEVHLAPFEAKWKCFILHEAERMLPYSSNALLKTFEEPCSNAVIILISSAPEALLPTIRSRCRMIRFQPLSVAEVAGLLRKQGLPEEQALHDASLSQGSMTRAMRLREESSSQARQILLALLANGKARTYAQLTQAAKDIAGYVDKSKKLWEEEARQGIQKGEDLTAVQREAIEKEIDGAISMRASQEALALLEEIAAWYRDVQLMQVNGCPNLIYHTAFKSQIQQVIERGDTLPIDQVLKHIGDTKLALERSTSLQICLETLFLKLNIV